jgi:C4-type Zn-finger protein
MAAKISKNNPDSRSSLRLAVFCPLCGKEIKAVKQIDEKGGSLMIYKCFGDKCDFTHPISKESYTELEYEWVAK